MSGGRGSRLLLTITAAIAIAASATPARAQGWSVDVGAGRFVYDAVSANVPSDNVTAAIRYDAQRDAWVFGAAGIPLGDQDTFWAAAGAGGRLLAPANAGPFGFGADLTAQGYSFLDRLADARGTGGTIEAIPFIRVAGGDASLELRGGVRGHTLSYAGERESRGVAEAGARAGYGDMVRIEGEARWVRSAEGGYPFAGGSVAWRTPALQLWAQGGKWLDTDLNDVSWGTGASLSLGARTTFWATVRQEAPDPLYWNPSRRTWSIGLTYRLQRLPPVLAPAPRTQDGRVVVRVRAADAPEGDVFIAGDFNNWQPEPMTREGTDWVIQLALAPGVYHYSFRSAQGEWFVPVSTSGRRDDGFGGHVAVVVVS